MAAGSGDQPETIEAIYSPTGWLKVTGQQRDEEPPRMGRVLTRGTLPACPLNVGTLASIDRCRRPGHSSGTELPGRSSLQGFSGPDG